MGLATRELLLVMRARDEMSSVIARNSNALRGIAATSVTSANKLLGAGVVLGTIGRLASQAGGAIVDFGRESHQVAVDFEADSALIATQAQDLQLSIEDISALTEELARAQPVTIPGLQQALFDIFSTFEGGADEVKKIAEAASILGVASAEDVGSFGGALSGVLNAFNLGAEDSMAVADLWFRMAEKGQITLGEFASVIGTAVSPALAFGQSLDTTSAAIAFLTKETDLSAEQASTATARLFDMLRKNAGDLDAAGIVVADSAGNYLPLIDVIDQLADATEGMSDIEQAAFLESIFGGGEIRAMRGLIPMIEDTETMKLVMGEANALVGEGGGLMDAYAIQMGTTAMRVQALRNEFFLLRREIGEALIPIFEVLFEVLERAIDWWNSLDEELRENIIQFTFIAGLILSVIGPLLTMGGALAVAIGVFKILGITFGFVVGTSVAVVAAIAAIIGIGWLLFNNWDSIVTRFEGIWTKFKEQWDRFVGIFTGGDPLWSSPGGGPDAIIDTLELTALRAREAWETLKSIFENIVLGVQAFWHGFNSTDEGTSGPGIIGTLEEIGVRFGEAWEVLSGAFEAAKEGIGAFWRVLLGGTESGGMGGGPFGARGGTFVDVMEKIAIVIRDIVIPALGALLGAGVELIGWSNENMVPGLLEIWDALTEGMEVIMSEVLPTLDVLLERFIATAEGLKAAWDVVSPYVEAVLRFLGELFAVVWDEIVLIVKTAITIVANIIALILNIIQGDWSGAWQNVKNLLGATWAFIIGTVGNSIRIVGVLLSGLLRVIITIFVGIGKAMFSLMSSAFSMAVTAVATGIGRVMAQISRIRGRIVAFFSGARSWLWSAGRRIMDGLLGGLKAKWRSISSWVSGIGSKIRNLKGPEEVDRVLLVDAGNLIMGGLQSGLETGWMDVERFLKNLNIQDNVGVNLNAAPMSPYSGIASAMMAMNQQTNPGLNVEGDLVLGSADDIPELDYWAQKRFSGV